MKRKRNGQTYETKNQIYKIEINQKKILDCDLKVTYRIRITNNGEVAGKVGKIIEKIPDGFAFYKEDNSTNWQEENGVLINEDLANVNINPNDSIDVSIVLRWKNNENNFGVKINTVQISNNTNIYNYEESTLEDNNSKSEIIITITTGFDQEDKAMMLNILFKILVVALVIATITTIIHIRQKKI